MRKSHWLKISELSGSPELEGIGLETLDLNDTNIGKVVFIDEKNCINIEKLK